MSIKSTILILLTLAFFSCSAPPQRGIDIIKSMKKNWGENWPAYMLFEQNSVFYKADSVSRIEIWQEAIASPGNLHVRFNGFDTQDGLVFTMDSMFIFKKGINTQTILQHHFLLTLCFDIYFDPPERTAAILEKEGFDMDLITSKIWKGRKVWVIGTIDPSDDQSNKFYIDAENFWVVRVTKQRQESIRDYEIGEYREIDGKWVATQIIFKENDTTYLIEEYFNIRFPDSLDQQIFNPDKFSETKW